MLLLVNSNDSDEVITDSLNNNTFYLSISLNTVVKVIAEVIKDFSVRCCINGSSPEPTVFTFDGKQINRFFQVSRTL